MKTSIIALLCPLVFGARVKQTQTSIEGVELRNYQEGVDSYIVSFPEGTTSEQIDSFCSGSVCSLRGNPSGGGAAWASVTGQESLRSALRSRSLSVDFVEADVQDSMIPIIEAEDSDGFSAKSAASWGLDAISVDTATGTGAGVTIYVQDTGVRVTHSQFQGRATSGCDFTSGGQNVCNGATNCAADAQGHGTHCAGTTAGKDYGVAKQANVVAVKTLGDNGSGSRSWQFGGINWVTEQVSASGKKAVLSMSLGGQGADGTYTSVIGSAVNSGVVVVVAAGNSNDDACGYSPAFAAPAITVGATDSNFARASYSNYGRCLDIMGPGSAITSSWYDSNSATNTISGTSMACPHVSGAAAIILAKNPSVTAANVVNTLKTKAQTGMIRYLKAADPNEFLWIGAGTGPSGPYAPPPPGGTPAPACRRRWNC